MGLLTRVLFGTRLVALASRVHE